MSNTSKNKWLVPISSKGDCLIIKGWYPASTNWKLDVIQSKQLQKTRVIFGIRAGEKTGAQPEVLFDQLPLPLFSGDNYVTLKYSPYWSLFEPVSVRTYFANPSGRCEKWGKSTIPVPTKESFFKSPNDAPQDCHMAIINGQFCFSRKIVEQNKFDFRHITLVQLDESKALPLPSTDDFSIYFTKRPKSDETVVKNKILQFVLESLAHYRSQHNEKLSAILLDCDPKYGYVIVALKHSPVISKKNLEIDEFELEQFKTLDAKELYGDKEFLSRKQFGKILEQVISEMASKELIIKTLASPQGIMIGYAYHDENIRWVNEP